MVSRAEARALDRAELLSQQAEELLADAARYGHQVEAEVRAELEVMVADRLTDANSEFERILAEARTESDLMKNKARLEVAALLNEAIDSIDKNTAQSAADQRRSQHDRTQAADLLRQAQAAWEEAESDHAKAARERVAAEAMAAEAAEMHARAARIVGEAEHKASMIMGKVMSECERLVKEAEQSLPAAMNRARSRAEMDLRQRASVA